MCESQTALRVLYPECIVNKIQGRVVRSTLPQRLWIITYFPNKLGLRDTEAAGIDVDVLQEGRYKKVLWNLKIPYYRN